MKLLLMFGSVIEATTGLVLLASPLLFARLLLGAEAGGASVELGRIAGIGLLGLGVACWPGSERTQQFKGMLAYGVTSVLYLVYLAWTGTSGVLLWPAIVFHAVYSGLLLRQRRAEQPGVARKC